MVSAETRAKISAARYGGVPVLTRCAECGRKKGASKRQRCVFCAAKWRAKNYPNSMLGRRLSAEHKEAMARAQVGRPTKPEMKVWRVLRFMFSPYLPYHYTGSGKAGFFISVGDRIRRPDFVATELKKVIEVFGRYWHKPGEEGRIVTEYKSAGWDCLVIWDDDFGRINIRDTIMEFTYPYEFQAEMMEDFVCT